MRTPLDIPLSLSIPETAERVRAYREAHPGCAVYFDGDARTWVADSTGASA